MYTQTQIVTAHSSLPFYAAWWQCVQLAHIHYTAVLRPGVKPITSWSQIQHPNYSTIMPPKPVTWPDDFFISNQTPDECGITLFTQDLQRQHQNIIN